MPWGAIELEPEVHEWLSRLSLPEFGRVAFHIDLLEQQGVLLDEPYTRQLRGKLRELRFYLGRSQTRITYFILPGRRIVLLTVFPKRARRESTEIDRAERAMLRCIELGHTADEEDTL